MSNDFTIPQEKKDEFKQVVDVLHLVYSQGTEELKPLILDETDRKAAIIFLDLVRITQDFIFFDFFKDGETLYKYLELAEINQTPFDMANEAGALQLTPESRTEFKNLTDALKGDMMDNIARILEHSRQLPDIMQDSIMEAISNDIQNPNNTDKPLADLFNADRIIENVIAPMENFYSILQGKGINMLPAIRTKNLVFDDITSSLDQQGNASTGNEEFTLNIKNYFKLQNGIPAYVFQFFDCLLWHFTLTGAKSTQIRLPLNDYMDMRGLKDIKEARKGILDSIAVLKQIEYNTYEGAKGKKPRWSGNISLYGGTGYIRNGIIYFNFNQDFYDQLKLYTPMDVSKQALQLNTHRNPNSFHFLKYIAWNYRMNEGKKRQDIISIETLISKSPALPSYDDVVKTDRAFNRRIVQPTFRDLDVLDAITYTMLSADGKEIADPNSLDYETFITCKIKVDYSKWPVHPERITNRRQHLEKAEKIRKQRKPKS